MSFKITLLLIVLVFSAACKQKEISKTSKPTLKENFNGVKEYNNFDDLAPIFNKHNDTVYVLNFWATTCPPCVKEMPLFEALAEEYKNEKFSILLISTDRLKDRERRLLPFLRKHHFDIPIVWLTDPNATKWTAAVNPKWYGALPYTVIYKNDKRKYYFGAFKNHEALKAEIAHFF